ncbi:MAG: ABC transporter ATP-binding protein [Thermomicrobiales bacterium]|nr:ABC transporter ATP-binding protein [Thermomicrobiales bacterium]MCO5220809.1 ABC transporter ATP-binding protein [Thermomicrobiales bacterium]
MSEAPPLLQVQGLVKHFPMRGGFFDRMRGHPAQVVRAVDDVDLSIREGETLALVGESGCGKSTTGRCILYLQQPTEGVVAFRGEQIDPNNTNEMRERRKQLQIVFQDPNSSLNPRMSVGQTLEEALAFHKIVPKSERSNRVRELLHTVGLNDQFRNRFANELSGGQRQRIGIARALAVDPELIVADEAVSALDVSVQAQILQLLARLREEKGLAYLFISHQLGVVRSISDAVAVMYLGKIVEQAPTEEIFHNPLHPYTQALMAAAPVPNPRARRDRILLTGDPPSPVNPPSGCRFRTRCRYATDQCAAEVPLLREIVPNHLVACHYAGELTGS